MNGPASWRRTSAPVADLDLLRCLPLVVLAYLVVVERSRLAAGHRAATRSGLDRAGAAWTITGRGEGTTRPVTAPGSPYGGRQCRPAAVLVAVIRARRAGPREHGRQAARSERDQPGRAPEMPCQPGHGRAAAGGALIQ